MAKPKFPVNEHRHDPYRNLQGSKVLSYVVHRCRVSEYQSLSELDAAGNAVLIQTMKIEHEGWERDTSVTEPTET